jgi:hypothetical protein
MWISFSVILIIDEPLKFLNSLCISMYLQILLNQFLFSTMLVTVRIFEVMFVTKWKIGSVKLGLS